MFDKLLSSLKRLERGMTVSVPIATDDRGYTDRECPSAGCEFSFKVHGEDWANLFRDEAVFCPRCRHSAPAQEWFTQAQRDHLLQQGLRQFERELDSALRDGARAFNQTHRHHGGLIQLSMTIAGPRPTPIIVPIPAAEAIELAIQCELCAARFAVIGCAFFCPCCGHNSVERTFNDSLRKIRAKVEVLDRVRAALRDDGQLDEAEIVCQSLLESAIQDAVGSFQRLCDEIYAGIPGQGVPPRNVFQRLDDASDLWRATVGFGYDDSLAPEELNQLKVLYQRRHLLAHRDGVVDAEYLRKTSDPRYREGQRIVVSTDDVVTMVTLVERLATGLRAARAGVT